MNKRFLYLTVCFSITSLFISQTPISKRKFQWQIHSFNDRRELTQVLRKGSTLIKIDLYYNPQNQCYTNDPRAYTDPRGCFLITHDEPTPTVRYDSIYDYFDEIVLHKSHFSNPNLHFDLALCFKHHPPGICEDETEQFLSLVDDIYDVSETIIHKYKLNMKMLHDTVKVPCMYPRWSNWGYTWIRTKEPDDAFYSNDTDLYYDKYIVFNNKDALLEQDAMLNYGKFKDMNRPVQIWEPIHQEDILYYAKIFQTYPHKAGYAFAINSDTSMYQVYSANVSSENLNYNLYTDKDSSTKSTVFKVINEKYLYVFRSVEKQIDFYTFDSKSNHISHISSLYNIEMPNNILKDILYMDKDTTKNKKHFIIMNTEGEYCLYEIENYKLNMFNCGKFIDFIKHVIVNEVNYIGTLDSFIKSASITLVDSHVFDDNKKDILLVYTTSQNQLNTAVFEYNISTNLSLTFISSYQNLISLKSHIEHLDIKCTSKHCLLLVKEYSHQNIISHLFNYYPRKTMLKFYASPYKNFGVGYFFSLSLSEVDNVKDKFILLKDNAFCYHSEEQNKDATIKMCDQIETMQPHILNYIYGDIDMESIYNEDNYGSVCNHHIMAGTYDMGDYPRVDLFRKDNGVFEFVEMHDGINKDMEEFITNCGLSRFYDGIVVDNWDVGDVVVEREKEIK